MPEAIQTYTVRSRGVLGRKHVLLDSEGQELGVLKATKRRLRTVGGEYRPTGKGEVLELRRDPGLLRGQFSLWTEGREWLGSSMRWNMVKREIQVETGSRPYRLLPLPGFGTGWRLCAPKTGEMARFESSPTGGTTRIQVFRRMDFELMLFAFFLGSLVRLETFWPGPSLDEDNEAVPSPSKA